MTPRQVRIALSVAIILTLAAVPLTLPALGASFWVNVAAEVMIWSLLAASVNLLLGYVGLLSFGQALYFGFGMYGVAIAIVHFGLSFWPAFGLGILASALMSAVAGALAVRLTWHYFAIITVVFSLIFYFLAMSAKWLTGGDDGLSFSLRPLFKIGEFELSLADQTTQYYFVFVVWFLCLGAKALLVRSPLGLQFEAVRENDRRAELVGINVYRTRWIAFVLAGVLAGIGGALFAFFGRYASASYMFYHVSGEAVVWTIVGGAGTLLGPIIGTAVLIVFREIVSTAWEHYLLAVGLIVILSVIFAPRGIVGGLEDLAALRGRARREDSESVSSRGPAE